MSKFYLFIFLFFSINLGFADVYDNQVVFGFHVHDPKNIKLASKIGYRTIRLWDTGTDWRSVSKKSYSIDYTRIDRYLRESEKLNLKVLWTLGNTPEWASARPSEQCSYGFGCAAEPKNIEDWRTYVSLIAKKYKGRVECYEPWNEVSFPNDSAFLLPFTGGDNNQFFSGNIKDMVLISKVAYEEIKKADPSACVTSPSFHHTGDWFAKFDKYLAAGGGRYFDVVSQHFYYAEEPEESVRVIRGIRNILNKHNLSNKPIWNTEVGMPFIKKSLSWPSMSTEDLVYSITLRTYLINLSEGVNRIYWYSWDNREFGFMPPDAHYDYGSAAASSVLSLFTGLKSANCNLVDKQMLCNVETQNQKRKVTWIIGKYTSPREIKVDNKAYRWGKVIEKFEAGNRVILDGRPLIMIDS